MVIEFEKEKETKGTVRFKEIQSDVNERPDIGTIYITKKNIPNDYSNKIKVTIEFLK